MALMCTAVITLTVWLAIAYESWCLYGRGSLVSADYSDTALELGYWSDAALE